MDIRWFIYLSKEILACVYIGENKMEETSGQIACKELGTNNHGKPFDDSINTSKSQQCDINNVYTTHDLCIEGVSGLNLEDLSNQCSSQNIHLSGQDVCKTINTGKGKNSAENTGGDEKGLHFLESSSFSGLNGLDSDIGSKYFDTDVSNLPSANLKERTNANMAGVETTESQEQVVFEQEETESRLEKTCETDPDVIAAKARRIDSNSDSQLTKFYISPEIKNSSDVNSKVMPRRHLSSGSDLDSLSDMSGIEEEGLIVGQSQEPCECDECLLDAEPENVQKPPPPFKKVYNCHNFLFLPVIKKL